MLCSIGLLPSDVLDALADLPDLRFMWWRSISRGVVLCFLLWGFEDRIAGTILLCWSSPLLPLRPCWVKILQNVLTFDAMHVGGVERGLKNWKDSLEHI